MHQGTKLIILNYFNCRELKLKGKLKGSSGCKFIIQRHIDLID